MAGHRPGDSDESGRNEVYIQSFPTPSGKYQVSTEGVPGSIAFLVWQSGALFFLGPDGVTLMAAEVRTTPTFQVGAPRKLFRLRPDFVGLDVTPDGRRILIAAPAGQASTGITLIENWTAALKR